MNRESEKLVVGKPVNVTAELPPNGICVEALDRVGAFHDSEPPVKPTTVIRDERFRGLDRAGVGGMALDR